MENEARRVLKEVFGYDGYRPHQESIIRAVLAGRDVLAVMPTGGGKSLCYQIPALIMPGLALVVSPLIALMRDQVGFLRGLGVDARFLNSSLERDEYFAVVDEIRSGSLKLLYAAPETLLQPRTVELLSSARLSFLTIDEAHCISEWGHDFRPEYRRLAEIRALFPGASCLALTATATERVRADMQRNLALRDPERIVAGFDRPNIALEVLPKRDALEQADEFARANPDGAGIVYCLSRKRVEEVAAYLSGRGHSARPYHAGLDDEVRSENQDLFVRDEVRIIVATVAFGMGIDKPDVRFVLHVDLPKSVEGYYQEIGRAGRDGLPSKARLLYSYGDVRKLEFTLREKEGQELEAARTQIRSMVRYAENPGCRRVALLSYFGQAYGADSCGSCDACADPAARSADVTEAAHKLLSAVARTGERYGPTYVIDVLCGDANEKVLARGHEKLPVFGLGKEAPRAQWMAFVRQMTASGYLEADPEFGTLSLTDKAWRAFKTREPILGRPLDRPPGGEADPARAERRRKRKRAEYSAIGSEGGEKTSRNAIGEIEGLNAELVFALRSLRTRLARETKVPPYMIFSDRSLADLALKKPISETELLDVFGMGKVKAARLGGEIFALMGKFRSD